MLKQFECKNFSSKEISAVVTSAYGNSAAFNTKFFENSEVVDKIKTDLNRGVPKKEVRSRLKDTGVEGEVVDSVINRVEETTNERTFWVKSQRGAVSIVHWKFKKFLDTKLEEINNDNKEDESADGADTDGNNKDETVGAEGIRA